MRKLRQACVVGALLWVSPALAADLTLNDLPSVLDTLRGCTKTAMFGTSCELGAHDLWVSVHTNHGALDLTLFTKDRFKDTTIYASGPTVDAMLADYARKLNASTEENAAMLKRLGQYLRTQ